MISAKNSGVIKRYLNFCERQLSQKIIWYVMPGLFLTSGLIPTCLFIVYHFNGSEFAFTFFCALGGLLFYLNVILSVLGLHTKYTITAFGVTVLLLVGVTLGLSVV